MDSITIRLPEETLEKIEQEADERDISKSEVIRDWFREREELQAECEQLQTECDRLHRERRQLLEQREEHTELVRYVQEERTLGRQRAEAGVLTRAKWWLTGMSVEDGEG